MTWHLTLLTERSVALGVACVDVGAGFDEQFDYLYVTTETGPVERGELVTFVHVDPSRNRNASRGRGRRIAGQ